MAINLSTAYPGKTTVDANNANGTFKNETSEILADGTPFEKAWASDLWGWGAHTLKQLDVTPDGQEENQTNSQYFDAQKQMFSACPGASKNLVIVNNSGSPTTQIDIDADRVVVQNASGVSLNLNNVNLTVATSTTGANGLDTGTVQASTTYYIYVIYNVTSETAAGLLSTNSTTPILPAGYTFFEPFGRVETDGSALLKTPSSVPTIGIPRVYYGDGTDFTVTGDDNWTTRSAIAIQRDGDPLLWYFNIVGDTDGTSLLEKTINVGGVVFKEFPGAAPGAQGMSSYFGSNVSTAPVARCRAVSFLPSITNLITWTFTTNNPSSILGACGLLLLEELPDWY